MPMNRRSVIKIIVRYLAVLTAVVIFVFWTAGNLLHWFPGAPKFEEEVETLLRIALAMLSALVLYEILRGLDKLEEEKVTQGMWASLRRLGEALHRNVDVKVDVVKSPSGPTEAAEYAELFSGFTEKYFVYNPSYRGKVEVPGPGRQEIIRDVFVPRYRDPNFRAFYLFLTKDGKQDLDEFRALMKDVKEQCPEVSTKLQVKELKGEAAAEDAEVYSGTKHGIPTSIVELKERRLTGGRGYPHYYLVVMDIEINRHLDEDFAKAWDRADRVQIFN